jgi:hypothetical protein
LWQYCSQICGASVSFVHYVVWNYIIEIIQIICFCLMLVSFITVIPLHVYQFNSFFDCPIVGTQMIWSLMMQSTQQFWHWRKGMRMPFNENIIFNYYRQLGGKNNFILFFVSFSIYLIKMFLPLINSAWLPVFKNYKL